MARVWITFKFLSFMDKIKTVTRYSFEVDNIYKLRWYHDLFVLMMKGSFFYLRKGDYMAIQIVLLVVGFVLLIKGADIFIDGASNLARNFKMSKMFVGLTIVAFGTSAPEFAVSIKSIISGSGEIVLGNVIGSNILNILLILGCSSLVHFLRVKDTTVKKEIPLVLLMTLLLSVLINDGLFGENLPSQLTRNDGIIILLFFSVFIYYLFSMMRNKTDDDTEDEIWSLFKSIGFTLLGIVAIIFGSNLVVDSATHIAKSLGVSERIIGLTIIALGTSLPELVTSVTATKKGEYDIAIGNIVGSNLFNIGIVLGLPILLFGTVSIGTFNNIDLIFMILSALALFIFARNDYKITRNEGIVFLLMFVVYYAMVLI